MQKNCMYKFSLELLLYFSSYHTSVKIYTFSTVKQIRLPTLPIFYIYLNSPHAWLIFMRKITKMEKCLIQDKENI